MKKRFTVLIVFTFLFSQNVFAQGTDNTTNNEGSNIAQYILDAQNVARGWRTMPNPSDNVIDNLKSIVQILVSIPGIPFNDVHGYNTTGTLISKDEVLTVFHIFSDFHFKDIVYGKYAKINVEVNGRVVEGYVQNDTFYDYYRDLLVIKLKEPIEDVQPISLAKVKPSAGEWLYTMGYSNQTPPTFIPVMLTNNNLIDTNYVNTPFGQLIMQNTSYVTSPIPGLDHGFSGGPLLNNNGEITSVYKSMTETGSAGYAISLETIKEFMNGIQRNYTEPQNE